MLSRTSGCYAPYNTSAPGKRVSGICGRLYAESAAVSWLRKENSSSTRKGRQMSNLLASKSLEDDSCAAPDPEIWKCFRIVPQPRSRT